MRPRCWLAIAALITLIPFAAAQSNKPGDAKDAKDSKDSKPPAGAEKPGYEPFKEGELGDKDKLKPTTTDEGNFRRMVNGRQALNAQLMDKMAQWLLYRLTWLAVQENRELGGIPQVLDEIFGNSRANPPQSGIFPTISTIEGADAEELQKRANQRQFIKEMRVAMAPHIRKVLQNKDLVARINAARVLARFAEAGEEEVADDMIRIIDNPYEHDGVRHWAIKGLGAVFAHQMADPAFGQPAGKPQRGEWMENGGVAICKWLKARIQVPVDKVEEMQEKEKQGIRYVRREAIHTLTTTHRPWAVEKTVGNNVRRDGPIAELLVQIMVAEEGKVSPEPTWEERVEAAYGLCFLDVRPGSNYQIDFVAQNIGRFTAALASAANDDKGRQSERWRYFGTRLRNGGEALKGMLDKTPPNVVPAPITAYAKKVLGQMEPAYNNLNDDQKDPQAAQNLNNWLNDNRAPTQELYKSG